jgi:hypothetical protein
MRCTSQFAGLHAASRVEADLNSPWKRNLADQQPLPILVQPLALLQPVPRRASYTGDSVRLAAVVARWTAVAGLRDLERLRDLVTTGILEGLRDLDLARVFSGILGGLLRLLMDPCRASLKRLSTQKSQAVKERGEPRINVR